MWVPGERSDYIKQHIKTLLVQHNQFFAKSDLRTVLQKYPSTRREFFRCKHGHHRVSFHVHELFIIFVPFVLVVGTSSYVRPFHQLRSITGKISCVVDEASGTPRFSKYPYILKRSIPSVDILIDLKIPTFESSHHHTHHNIIVRLIQLWIPSHISIH